MTKPRKVRRYRYPRYRRRRSGGMTLPLAPLAGLSAGLISPIQKAISGNWTDAGKLLISNYTGIVGEFEGHAAFDGAYLWNGLAPLVAGLLVHKFIGGKPLNFNGMLARAKVPFIRI